jgi:hypothetical protein
MCEFNIRYIRKGLSKCVARLYKIPIERETHRHSNHTLRTYRMTGIQIRGFVEESDTLGGNGGDRCTLTWETQLLCPWVSLLGKAACDNKRKHKHAKWTNRGQREHRDILKSFHVDDTIKTDQSACALESGGCDELKKSLEFFVNCDISEASEYFQGLTSSRHWKAGLEETSAWLSSWRMTRGGRAAIGSSSPSPSSGGGRGSCSESDSLMDHTILQGTQVIHSEQRNYRNL